MPTLWELFVNWSDYYYLAFCALCGLALLVFAAKMMPSLTAKHPKPTRTELSLLIFALILGTFVIYGTFLTGRSYFAYRDAGLDTVDQYVPFYLNLLDSIRDGSFGAWNFEYGLGTSILSYQSWLLDPFNIVLVPLGLLLGNTKLSLILALVQALKIVLSGILFNRLATRFCETPLARILGSMTYAFSGYLLLWGQHYWLGSVSVAFVAFILTLELLTERWSVPRFVAVVFVTAICVGWSPYCGFMILVSGALYMLLRLIHLAHGTHSARQVVRGTGRLLVPVLCGILIAGIVLVPYVMYLFSETSRVSSTSQPSLIARMFTFFTEFVPANWIPGIASRLLGNSLITSGGDLPLNLIPATESFPYVNCYEFISLGFGACSIILLGQFFHWTVTETSRRTRILIFVATAIIIAYCVNNFLPALLNAFVAPKYRSSFVLAVPLCLALSIGWEKRIQTQRVARIPLLVSSALSVAILAWSLINTVDGRLIGGFCLLCTCAFTILLWVRWPEKVRSILILAAFVLAVIPVIADGFFITNNRHTCTETNFPNASARSTSSDTEAALAYLDQTDSTLFRVEKTYIDWCDFNDSLVEGYNGVNSYNSTTDGEIIDFYRIFWPGALMGGGAYQGFANDSDGLSLASRLGTRYLLSKTPLENNSLELLTTCGTVYVYKNSDETPLLSGAAYTISESDIMALSSIEERRALLDQAIVVPDEFATSVEKGPKYEAAVTSELVLTGSSEVRGTVTARGDATACLAIPHTAGWIVKIDGEEVQTFRANFGFIGFYLSPGLHTVEAHYSIQGFALGAILSALGALIALLVCLRFATRSRTVY